MLADKENILDQQEAEAERLGITLEKEDDQSENSDVSEEEKPQPKKIEKEEDKSEDEDKTEDEDESESEDDTEDKPEVKRPPKGSLAQQASLQREQTRISKIVGEQVASALTPVMDMLKELKTAKTPEQKTEVAESIDDELAKIAEEEKIPLDQFKKIAGLITKQVQATLEPRLKQIDDVAPLLEQRTQQERERQYQEEFNQEWETQAEPILTGQYPTATAKQVTEARKLLATLAVSADYGDTRGNKDGVPEHQAYPVDYIIYKEAEKFDSLLRNPHKKSFESSSNVSDDSEDQPTKVEEILADDKEITSASQAIKRTKALDKATYGQSDRLVVSRDGKRVDITD